MRIVDKLSEDGVLEKLESDCGNSADFVKRQVAFCARWSLDNLCRLLCSVCLCMFAINLQFFKSAFSARTFSALSDTVWLGIRNSMWPIKIE